MMDEFGVWNRPLTDNACTVGSTCGGEIEQLYNGGSGINPSGGSSDTSPTVELNSPASGLETETALQTFTCYGSDAEQLINMSFVLDGSINETNSSGLNATNYTFSKTLSIGSHNWSCKATDNASQSTEPSARSILIYNTPEWTANYNDDILAFYDMENSSLTDVTGISGDGVSFGGNTFGEGIVDNGMIVDNVSGSGNNGFQVDNVTTTSGVWTVSIWANHTNTDTSGTHYYMWDSYGGGTDRENAVLANGKIHTDIDGPDYFYTNDSTSLADGVFHNYVAVLNSTESKLYLYVDGDSVANYSSVANTDINTNTAIGTSYSGVPGANWSGTVDEGIFWDRALNVSEIQFYYNLRHPPAYATPTVNNPPVITLNSPSTGSFTSPQNITINLTASDDYNLTNVSLYVNGILNQTNSSGLNATDYFFDLVLGDGTFNILGQASDNESLTTNSSGITITIDSISPLVNITNPLNGTIVYDYNESLQLNWTALDTNLDSCVYSFDEISEISSDDGDSLNSTSSGIVVSGWVYVTDNSTQSWNYQINDAFGGTMNIKIAKDSNTPSVEGDIQTLSQNAGVQNTTMDVYGNGYHYFEISHTPFGGSLGVADLFRAIGPTTLATDNNLVSCALNTTNINYPLSNPDNATIRFVADDTLGTGSLDSVMIFRSTVVPVINLTSPPASFGVLENGDSIDLNWTITTSGTLDTCFYEYNYTNTTVTCGLNTSALTYISGVDNITLYANDTLGNINSAFTSWTIALTEYQQFYVNETFEGITNPFWVYVGTNESIVSANLNYNGTNYTGIITELVTDQYNVSYELIAPSIDNETNFTFYWEIELSSGILATLTSYNQTVLPVNLDNCSVYNYTILNLSLFEERNKNPLIGTIEVALNVLDTVDYSIVQELSGLFENVNSTLVCSSMNLSGQDLVYSAEIKYYSDEFASELYFIQRSPFEGIDSISLFDLNSSYSTEFLVEYENSNFIIVPEAVLQLQRKYISEDIYEVVEAPLTSTDGTAIFHVDLDSNLYKVTVVKNGVVLDIFDNIVFDCQNELSGECSQKLRGSINPANSVSIETLNDFGYTLSNDEDTVTITYAVPSGTSSSVNFQVVQRDSFGNETLCNKTVVSSAGSIICTYDNNTITDSYLFLTLTKDNESQVTRSYYVRPSGDLDFLDNEFIIVFIFMLSLIGMAFSSPEWIVVNGVVVMLISGSLYLLSGLNFVMGLGNLMWIILAGGIIIYKMTKQEDR
jgi:hypothetical protein